MARQPLGGLGRLIFRGFTITRFKRTTLGRTPLDEGPARRRDLYLTTNNTHNRHTSMPPVGFEPTILVSSVSIQNLIFLKTIFYTVKIYYLKIQLIVIRRSTAPYYKDNCLKLFREKIGVYWDNHKENINNIRVRKMTSFWMSQQGQILFSVLSGNVQLL
jgi:hypothetical protein